MLEKQRRLFGLGLLGLIAFATFWHFFWNGIPVIWGPSASAADVKDGRELFEHEWIANDPLAKGDGLGPVFNARSCAACHFQGGLGGGGELMHNAVAFEVLPRPNDTSFRTGSIHNFSVNPAYQESVAIVRKLYPVIPGQTIQTIAAGCDTPISTRTPDFDPVSTESVQTTALFGAGWIDLIAEKAIVNNRRNRLARGAVKEFHLKFEEIPVGRLRSVAGGSVGRFGWKAQFATLKEFVAAACANELGLGTPDSEQAKPLLAPNLIADRDLDKKQFRALVAFVKTLPQPVEIVPDSPTEQSAAIRGKELFESIGCAVCHVPDLGGVKGVYSDFLLYTLEDPTLKGGSGGLGSYDREPPPQLQLPPRPDDEPKQSEWKTSPLWGVADSAPYLHDGSAPTLHDAILRHRGDARTVHDAYQKLTPDDRSTVISFLKTLKAPPDAIPLRDPNITKLAKK